MIATGRLTCTYKVTGTNTLRLASAKLLDYYGTNLQNPTESLMACVEPSPGNIFIQPDQAGAEALVVAYETNPGKFRRLFDLGIKPHSYMALQLFTDKFRGEFPCSRYRGVDPDVLASFPELKGLLSNIKHSPDEYFLGKKTIHSFDYDEGLHTFRITTLQESEGRIVLSFAQSKEFKGVWSDTFKEIVEWQVETVAKCKRDGVLYNLFGYPRRFEKIWTDEKGRQAMAFVPQSTVATISNIGFTELWHCIRHEHLPWKLLNNKHDSILLEVPDTTEHKDRCIEYCSRHMGRELVSSRGEHYKMKVGISIGYNWGHYHEKDNPTGLKEL